jgi:hypothetical protein
MSLDPFPLPPNQNELAEIGSWRPPDALLPIDPTLAGGPASGAARFARPDGAAAGRPLIENIIGLPDTYNI